MQIKRLGAEWWIVEVPDTISECGPYTKRAEAEEDLRGLTYFFDVFRHTQPNKPWSPPA